jgi:methyl-accepting chemotaxis protein
MKLSIGSRLWIIFALSLAPLSLLTYLFWTQSRGDIAFADKEIRGSQYLNEIWPQVVQSSQPESKPPSLPHAADFDAVFGTQDASAAFAKAPDARSRASSGKALIGAVADGSNLTLDPDLDSFYVMDAVTVRLPGIVQAAVELRDAAHAAAGAQKVVSLASAVQELKSFASDADGSLSASMKNNAAGDTRRGLSGVASDLNAAATQVLDLSQLALNGKVADDLDRRVADLLDRTNAAWAAADSELARLLQARVDRLTSNLIWKLAEVALLLGVTAAVLIKIARGVTQPLNGLTAGMRKLADGDFDAVLPGLGRSDEIGEIARAVEAFKLKSQEKSRLEADERIAQQQKDAEAQAALAREREIAALSREKAAAEAAREQAKVAAEREHVAAEQAEAMQKIGGAIVKLAQKDLTFRMTEKLPELYEPVRTGFNEAITQLEEAIGKVATSARTVTSGAHEISTASNDLARRTAEQASSLEETSAALSGVSDNVDKAATGAAQAEKAVSSARLDADRGAEIVKNAIQSMSRIEASSGQIRNIIAVIDEIAFQTNLLALNAGVEAARAGDTGRGFAVVASEVRALAQRSAEAAKEIKGLVAKSAEEVGEGVSMVTETGKALNTINAHVAAISSFVTEFAANSKDQAGSLREVNRAVGGMDSMTQQNAAMSEEATAASQSLARESEILLKLVGQFQAAAHDDADLRRRLEAAAPHAFVPREPDVATPSPRAKPHRARTVARAAAVAPAAKIERTEEWAEF